MRNAGRLWAWHKRFPHEGGGLFGIKEVGCRLLVVLSFFPCKEGEPRACLNKYIHQLVRSNSIQWLEAHGAQVRCNVLFIGGLKNFVAWILSAIGFVALSFGPRRCGLNRALMPSSMNLFQMLWLLNVAAVCGWNEQVIRDLQTRQFIAETQMPPPVGLQDWDWAQRECFLPLPTQAPELLIFRSIVPTRNIPSFLRLSIPGDAVASDVVRRIDRTWDDIVHTDGVHVHWALNMVDRSVGRSMRIPRNIKAFILVTHAEHGRLLRHEAVVLLEVVCEVPNTQGGWAFTEARHMSRRQNRANLIFEIGFARACSQTHRCRVLHNGEYVRNRDVYLNVADFIVLLMRSIYALDPPLIEPSWDPSDSDNEPIFSHSALDPPAAEPSGQSVFGEAADEVEMETGSATTESSISSVTTATSSTRFLVVLHRPRLGHVPSQVHAFASTIDQRTVYAEARATWRDLQTDPFSLLKVHDSFEDDFSWDPNHLCLLVINEREFWISLTSEQWWSIWGCRHFETPLQ